MITRCFEPDSIDLMIPLAVDGERDDDDDDEGIAVVSPTISYARSPYRPLQST